MWLKEFWKRHFLIWDYLGKDCAACGSRNSLFTVDSVSLCIYDGVTPYSVRHMKCGHCGTSYSGQHEKLNELNALMAERKVIRELVKRVEKLETIDTIREETKMVFPKEIRELFIRVEKLETLDDTKKVSPKEDEKTNEK